MTYKDLGAEVGELVDEKNTAYGNSFNVAEDFIKLLWPKGVPPESFNDMLCVVRIFDKLKRIATNKAYGGESPYRDIAGYALLGLMKDQVKPEACIGCKLPDIYAHCPVHSPYPEGTSFRPTVMTEGEAVARGLKHCKVCDDWYGSEGCPTHYEATIDETKWEPFPKARPRKRKNKA